MDLAQPLSANMELVRHIAQLALEPSIYVLVFLVSASTTGLMMTFNWLPSLSAIYKNLDICIHLAVALLMLSIVSTLPSGYVILIPGVLATFVLPMLLIRKMSDMAGHIGRWVTQWSTAKKTFYRHNPALLIPFLFTRKFVRFQVFFGAIAIASIGLLGGGLPFYLMGAGLVFASFLPRSVWWGVARKSYRAATAKRRVTLTLNQS
ncbi:MAG: hypothetical protein JXQ84_06475 [Rhodospirillaceae bacterium]|nr:hypothetical protein [Rhodospirillaceae bacterium]